MSVVNAITKTERENFEPDNRLGAKSEIIKLPPLSSPEINGLISPEIADAATPIRIELRSQQFSPEVNEFESTNSFESARLKVVAEESLFSNRIVSNADISVEPGVLRLGDELIPISDEGLERICSQVNAPIGYLTNLDPEIQSHLLQHHVSRGDLGRERVELITRAGELVAIERPLLHRLSGVNVLDAVADAVRNTPLTVHKLKFSHEAFSLELISESHHTEVMPDDFVHAGLHVEHSFVGEQATTIEGFQLRQICSNGMTQRQCITQGATRTRRLPASRNDAHALQMEQIRRLTADTLKTLQAKLEALKNLAQEPAEVESLIRRWIERARLSHRLLGPLLQAAWQHEGSSPTAYGAMNALTRVATHGHNLTARTRRALSSLAGILASRQIHFCPRCFSIVNASAASSEAT